MTNKQLAILNMCMCGLGVHVGNYGWAVLNAGTFFYCLLEYHNEKK